MIRSSKADIPHHIQFCSGVFCIVFRVCHVVDDVSECEVCEVKWALAAVGLTEQL